MRANYAESWRAGIMEEQRQGRMRGVWTVCGCMMTSRAQAGSAVRRERMSRRLHVRARLHCFSLAAMAIFGLWVSPCALQTT